MNHFIRWKFGVPVKILNNHGICTKRYLVYEDDQSFSTVDVNGAYARWPKHSYLYELISHKSGTMSPRYPVCQAAKGSTAYCNQSGVMSYFDAQQRPLQPFSAATLNIDGKTIELSAETTAELKKKLEI